MSCPKTILISAYLDKELQGSAALEAHIQGCAQCGAALQDMRSLRSAFSNTERHPAPFGFSTRVITRAAELEKNTSPWFVPFFIRFAEAAVLLFVITAGIFAGKIMTNNPSLSKTTNVASSLSLDVFDATPPGSLGGAYLAMTEVRNEK